MAERRMFSKEITESDAFLEMPSSTQILYFHLSLNADDDGFVNSPNKIMAMCKATTDDIKLLILKSFVIPFDSGVLVIKHWRMNNYLRSDRYKTTPYQEELSLLEIKKNGAYTLIDKGKNGFGIPMVDQRYTQNSIDKCSKEKKEIYKERKSKDTAPIGAIHTQQLGDAPLIGVEDENKDIPFSNNNGNDGEERKTSVELQKIMEQTPAQDIEREISVEDEKKTSTKAPAKVSEATIINYFATVWEKYPKKVNKIQALKTFKYKLDGLEREEARNKANKIFAMLISQVKAWASEGDHGRDIEYIPHFATWLNANLEDANGKLRCK